jgi:hypothetical protein
MHSKVSQHEGTWGERGKPPRILNLNTIPTEPFGRLSGL